MSVDELVVAVKELQAQRRQDQSTWPELAGILDEYAQRIVDVPLVQVLMFPMESFRNLSG